MSNLYANLDKLKNTLGISITSDDALMVDLLEAASRSIDSFCNRHFYVETATKFFDGSDEAYIIIEDLLDPESLKMDTDLDGVYDNEEWETTDYNLYPLNKYPKTWLEENPSGDYSIQNVPKVCEIVGEWGYGDGLSATPYSSSGGTITATDATTTSVTASDGSLFVVGQTILTEDELEQMYISAISDNILTVTRAVNGTTGIAHSSEDASIYDYPADIARACVMIASRLYGTRGQVGYKSEKLGDYSYSLETQPTRDERMILDSYRRISL